MDERTAKRRHSYGEKSNSTPLTANDVVVIRGLHAQGDLSLAQIGARYGMTKTGIWKIVMRITWKHV